MVFFSQKMIQPEIWYNIYKGELLIIIKTF